MQGINLASNGWYVIKPINQPANCLGLLYVSR